MKRQQSGFTLIELIMVIVILGILSAFAVPKFADLAGDAERAATEGARAAVKSASGIVHASYLVNNAATVVLEDVTVDIVDGYVSGSDSAANGHICDAAGIEYPTEFTCTSAGTGPAVMTISLAGSTCSFTYTEALSTATPPTPAISTITGC